MEPTNQPEALLPPGLLAQVEAMAAIEHRSAREVLREAVEHYLREGRLSDGDRQSPRVGAVRTPQEAAERMMARRKFHPLPEGMTIHDLIAHGRA